MIWSEFVHRPYVALEDHGAGDMFDPFCVRVPKCVDGGGGFGIGEIMDAVGYSCPDGDGVLDGVSVFVLRHRFIIIVILLIDEGYGYGGGCVLYFSVCYTFVSMTEYDCL